MTVHSEFVAKQLNAYREAVRSACQNIRAPATPLSRRQRSLSVLDSAWKIDPWVADKRVDAQILRAGIYSVLFRMPGRGIPDSKWPRANLTLDDALARLAAVLSRGPKVNLNHRMLKLANLIRCRLAEAAKVAGY